MLLTKFSNLQIIYTACTNLAVADMLSRDFSQITTKMCVSYNTTLSLHVLN